MISLFLADDQELIRDGLRTILDAQPDMTVVGEAGNGRDAVSGVHASKPDVVLMDVRMPTLDGIEATRRLSASGVPTRVLMLTTFDLDEHVYDALRAGASGFLLKDVPKRQLVEAVRTVAEGDALLAPAVTRRLVEGFLGAPRPSSDDDQALAGLTERERQVLALVARGRSNTEIASEMFVTESTVKTHVGNVLGKLNLRDRVQIVVYAYERGIVRPGR